MTHDRPKRFPLALADVVRVDGSAHGSRAGHPKASPARPGSDSMKRPGSVAAQMAKSSGPAAAKQQLKPAQPSSQQTGGAPSKPLAATESAAIVKIGPLKPAYARLASAKHAPVVKPLGRAALPQSTLKAVAIKPHAVHPANTINPLAKLSAKHSPKTQREASNNSGPVNGVLNSDRVRERMVERLRAGGIRDNRVLDAIAAVPRHQFVDAGLATQAYEDDALPIGHHQTISKPSVVARMIELAAAGRPLNKVLEIGTGCGYQAAVLSQVAREVYSIERIKPLFERAKSNLRPLRIPNIRLHYGDGRQGLPGVAPFDAIVLAAAGLEVPQALLEQLEIGGRLVAPVGGEEQVLTLIERLTLTQWRESRLGRVFFVPLKSGVV